MTVHIIDTGKGIKPDEVGQLFKQFGKLMRTAEMNSEGIGMGLMICQNLVNVNNGSISVSSRGEDQGSTFSFTFQIKKYKQGDNSDAQQEQQIDSKRDNKESFADSERKKLQNNSKQEPCIIVEETKQVSSNRDQKTFNEEKKQR